MTALIGGIGIGICMAVLCFMLCRLFLAYAGFKWSRVNKPFQKPLSWWHHKILCEFGYFIYQLFMFDNETLMLYGNKMYYKHLSILCKKGYNLYGDKI
jgi:hypothetical protein